MIVIPQIWVKQLTASLEEYLGKIKIRDLALYLYCSLSLRTIHLLPRFQTISHLQRYFNPNTAALQLFIHINPDIRRTTLRNPSASRAASLKTMHYKKLFIQVVYALVFGDNLWQDFHHWPRGDTGYVYQLCVHCELCSQNLRQRPDKVWISPLCGAGKARFDMQGTNYPPGVTECQSLARNLLQVATPNDNSSSNMFKENTVAWY